MTEPRIAATLAELLPSFCDRLLSSETPIRWRVGNPEWDSVRLEPGSLVLLGGAPGSGKTALGTQWVLDALRVNQGLRAMIANAEMPTQRILERQLSRLSGVSYSAIRERSLDSTAQERIAKAFREFGGIADRLFFTRQNAAISEIAAAFVESGAEILLLDYLQLFSLGAEDRRKGTDTIISAARQFASDSRCLLLISAVGRQRDRAGKSGYTNLTLASFKESGLIEYSADEAFLIAPCECEDDDSRMMLAHVKSRDGECKNLSLRFHRSIQRFTVDESEISRKSTSAIQLQDSGATDRELAIINRHTQG